MPLRSEGASLVSLGRKLSPQVFNDGIERLSQRVRAVARPERCWMEKICAGLLACLELLEEEPQLARGLLDQRLAQLVERECARRLEAALGEVLERARRQVIVAYEVMPSASLLAELVVGGALSLMRAHVRNDRPLTELVPALMVNVVEPYLARGAAQADLAVDRSTDDVCGNAHAEVAPIRITPDTLGVLAAIAASPGLSSVQLRGMVGLTSMDRAREIVRRLRKRGLIEKSGATHARRPSVWLLTPYGRRILQLADHRLERVA